MSMRWLSLVGLTALLSAVAACTVWRPAPPELLTERAIAYNLAADEAKKKLLLLNIVRAMLHEPRFFTAIAQIREIPDGSVAPSLTFPFGGDAPSIFTFGLAAKGDTSTWSVDISVLDSQDFTRGLLEPVNLEVMDYFWQQGWPKELLLMLLVRRIDLPSGKSLVNYPDSQEAVVEFQKAIEDLLARNLRIEIEPAVSVGQFVQAEPDVGIGELVLKAHEQGLELRVEGERYMLLESSPAKRLAWDPEPVLRGATDSAGVIGGSPVEEVKFYIRSPEGVIYFLGQIMREQEENPSNLILIHGDSVNSPDGDRPCEKEGKSQRALFIAQRRENFSDTASPPVVEVAYKGVRYAIPPSVCERQHYSMSVLTLVSQLVDLNKHRSELPATGVVTAIGGN